MSNDEQKSGQNIDDAEGHALRSRVNAEETEGNDAEGHLARIKADGEQAEGDDEAEGHGLRSR